MKKSEWVQGILDNEGLSDWHCKVIHSGGGLCLIKEKEIWIDEKHWDKPGMWLHEIAHAILSERKPKHPHHDSIFADKLTHLINKYLVMP